MNKVYLGLCYPIHDSFTFLKKGLEDFADFGLVFYFPCIFFLVTYILCDMIYGYFYLENIGLHFYI